MDAPSGPSEGERIDPDECWSRDFDIQEEVEGAKKFRTVVDGSELHSKLQRMLSKLNEAELADVALSWIDLAPCLAEPFEMVSATTLAKLLEIPEARDVSEEVAGLTRFLLSLHCAAMEEWAKRIETRPTREGQA